MFSFLFYKKRSEVARLLTARVNHHCFTGLDPRERTADRTSYCEVVWLITAGPRGKYDYENAVPVVSKDISPQGLALIHTAPIEGIRVLIGLRSEAGMSFLACEAVHSSPLGCGFYQIGLTPTEVVNSVPQDVANSLRARFTNGTEQREPALAGSSRPF
jgi:hypothetical protein